MLSLAVLFILLGTSSAAGCAAAPLDVALEAAPSATDVALEAALSATRLVIVSCIRVIIMPYHNAYYIVVWNRVYECYINYRILH